MGEGSSTGRSARRLNPDAAEPLLERIAKPEARILGKRSWFGVAIDLDSLLSGVHYYFAILAMLEVLFDGSF